MCDTNSALFSVILAKDGGSLDNTPNIYFVSRVAVWKISRSLLMTSCLAWVAARGGGGLEPLGQ